jgi:hypothetical protein
MHVAKIKKQLPLLLRSLLFWHSFLTCKEKYLMSTNLIEAIQKKIEYATLQKVDPNNQETKEPQAISARLAQGAIPAVLTAFYKLLRTDDGCKKLISADPSAKWMGVLYEGKEGEVVEKIAQYGAVTKGQAEGYMENIANEAASLIKGSAGSPASPEKIKTYMNSQRHNILVYLPAELSMGDLLNDESLDDRTNKMEGPISNFVHKIENNLSGGE